MTNTTGPAASQPPVTPPEPVADPAFSAGKRMYAEMFGDALVTNTYLKIAILALSLVIVVLGATQLRTLKALREFRPLIIRIDAIGRAETLRYDDLAYTPQETELKYFLTDFVQLYYSRSRATIAGNYAKALSYLGPELGEQIIETWKTQNTLADYAAGRGIEVDVDVKAVAIEDLRSHPIRARVDFEMIYYRLGERTEAHRVLYTANIAFDFAKGVIPPHIARVNPLGIQILNFRENEVKK